MSGLRSHRRFALYSTLALALVAATASNASAGDEPHARTPSWTSELRGSGGVSNFGGQGALGARFETRRGVALSATLLGAYGTWFVGGLASEKALTLGGAALAEIPFAQSGITRFSLRTALGARSTAAADLLGDPRSFVLTADVGLRATVQVSSALELYLGAQAPVALAVSPDPELEEISQVGEVGADLWLNERVALTLQGRVGGTFGYGGDGAKALAQGNLGIRVALDTRRAWVPVAKNEGVGLFVAMEWRANRLASHLSHGPAFAAGIAVLDRHLKIGLLASTRPGPFNAETFPTRPVGQATYKGQRTLALRSDGGFIGLLIAPSFDLPWLSAINVETPISVGQSAYGFYLHGNDRKTPDGRRVSAWENELFDGRDAAPAFGVDVGVKLGVRIPGARFLKPYVAARYTWNFGYDAYVTDNYNGPSAALGLEIER